MRPQSYLHLHNAVMLTISRWRRPLIRCSGGAPQDLPDCRRVEARRSKARQSSKSKTASIKRASGASAKNRRDGQAHHRYPRIEARCVKNSFAHRARGAGTHIAYDRISLLWLESFCFNVLFGYALQVAARLLHGQPWRRPHPGSTAPSPPCPAARGPRA